VTTLTTDANGYTPYAQVPAGTTISFTASKAGYTSVSKSLTINSDMEIAVTLAMIMYQFRFKVVDASEKPIEGAQIVY